MATYCATSILFEILSLQQNDPPFPGFNGNRIATWIFYVSACSNSAS